MKNEIAKKKLYFLYADEHKRWESEATEFIESINFAVNHEAVHIIMETLSDIPGYEEMRLQTDFEKYEAVFFFLKDFCTDCQEQSIQSYIRYRKTRGCSKYKSGIEQSKNPNYRCDGYIFQQKISPIDDLDSSIKAVDDFIKHEGNAYIIPCLTFDTVKFGMLIAIFRACCRHGFGESLQMHDGQIYLDNMPVLSSENIPEILVNKKSCASKNEMDTAEENLLLCFRMIYDISNQWNEAGYQIVKSLYQELAEGRSYLL